MKKLSGILFGLALVLCAFSAQAASLSMADVPSLPAAVSCDTDEDCIDEFFCNGIESCSVANSTCVAGTPPCGDDTPVCDEDNDTCVECLTDDNCTGGDFCVENICVECRGNDDCFDFDPCNGIETCVDGGCVAGTPPCGDELCEDLGDGAFRCYGCDNDTDCDDGLFCTGVETCDNGTCSSSGDPCVIYWNSMPAAVGPYCDEENDQCVECLSDDNCTDNATPFCVDNTCVECADDDDCDNGLFCDGAEVCDNGTCLDGEPPCDDNGTTPFCDEELDQCVECRDDGDCIGGDNNTPLCDGAFCVQCITDTDCDNGTFCIESVCTDEVCQLIVKPRKVRLGKKFRPIQRRFRIKGPDCFDPYAPLDFGVFEIRRAVVNRKGVLKVLVNIPPGVGLVPGPYEIRVGDAVGEVMLK